MHAKYNFQSGQVQFLRLTVIRRAKRHLESLMETMKLLQLNRNVFQTDDNGSYLGYLRCLYRFVMIRLDYDETQFWLLLIKLLCTKMMMNTECNSNLLFIKYIYYTVQVEFCYNVAHISVELLVV